MGRMPRGRFSDIHPKNLSKFAAIACLLTGAGFASAQETIIVTEQGARLHAGPNTRLYTIRMLDVGTRLQTLGEPAGGMIPVAYPADLAAYVPASSVEVIDTDSLRVSRATRLIAPHASDGIEGSWRSVLQSPIRPGSELTIRTIIRSEEGEILGYMVQAPPGATAYIAQSTIDSNATTINQSTDDTTGDTTAEANAESIQGTNLLDDMVPPKAGDAQAELAGTPDDPTTRIQDPNAAIDQANSGALATNQPLVIDQGTDTTPNADQSLTPTQLEALYQSARASDEFDQELDALLSEHRRTLDALADDQFNARIRQQLGQRIAYLEMRIAFRDGPARVASKRDGQESVSERMASKLDEFTAGRGYALVGKLVPSRIYDGRNLPKLYRLRSPDALGRTLGYVRPGKRDLTAYLNQIVGIAGKIESGPGGSKIITPTRVESIDEP